MSQLIQGQMKVEASTFSRSNASTGEKLNKMTLISGRTSIFDGIFPLLDEALKSVSIPRGIYLIMMIFVIFQLISVSLWQPFDWQFHYDTKLGQAISWIIKITLFSDIGAKDRFLIRFVIFTIFAVTFVLYLAFQYVAYKINRSYYRFTLYVAILYYEFFSVMMLVPCGNFIGETLVEIIEDKDHANIAFLSLAIIYYFIFIYGHYCNSYLISSTIYIPAAPNASWCGITHFVFIFVVSVYAILGWISVLFSYWIQPIILISKIVFSIFILYMLTNLPFIHLESNAIVAALHLVLIMLDLLAFIQYFGVDIPYTFHIILFFVLFILGIGIFKKYIKIITKKISKQLDDSALETIDIPQTLSSKSPSASIGFYLNDPARKLLLKSYGLHKNSMKCKLYLRVGIANACPLFIDWTLIKFVAEFHNNSSMIAMITQYIAFFPCESRILNMLNNYLVTMSNLSFSARFLAFQTHRIKGIRQSSVSSEITEKLMELKQLSAKGVNMSRSFWTTLPKDPTFLLELCRTTINTSKSYQEATSKWPNNSRLNDDYSSYLIECGTDFIDGIKTKYKAQLIENGKNFAIDYSFRSLVRAYPLYLKKYIMDIKGNFYNNNRNKLSGNSSNGSSGSRVSFATNGDIDAEIEEQVGKSLFNYHRLRLAFQRSLINRKSKTNTWLKSLSFFALFVAIVLILYLYGRYFTIFDDRDDRMRRQFLLTNIRYGYDAAFLIMELFWGYSLGFIDKQTYDKLSKLGSGTNLNNIHLGDLGHQWPPVFEPNVTNALYTRAQINVLQEIIKWLKDSMNDLWDFKLQAEQMAHYGTDVSVVLNTMVDRVVSYDYCNLVGSGLRAAQMPIGRSIEMPLSSIMSYSMVSISNLTQLRYGKGGITWLFSKGVCECVTNIWSIHSAFDDCYTTLSDSEYDQKHQNSKTNMSLMIGIISAFCLIFCPTFLVSVRFVQKELYGLLDIMANVDKKSREEAACSLKSNYMEDYEAMNDGSLKICLSFGFLYFMVVGCVAFMCAIFMGIIFMAEQRDKLFLELNQWMYYGVSRANLMTESFIFTLCALLAVKRPGAVPMINTTLFINLASSTIRKLLVYNNYLLRGRPAGADGKDFSLNPCIGIISKLDELHFHSTCKNNDNYNQTEYSCMSIDSGLSLFGVYINGMLSDLESVEINNQTTFANSFDLMNNHLIDPTYEAASILTEYSQDLIDQFTYVLSYVCFGIITFMLILFCVFYGFLILIDMAFTGAFQLLRRLPPISIVSNTDLLNYLLNKKEDKNAEKMTPAKSVILGSKAAVIFMSKSESIELVNKSVSALFGYTPEQLLGQPLSTIIRIDDNTKLYEQIGYMREGDAPLVFESIVYGVTDDEQVVSLSVTLIGVPDAKQNQAESFVVIMRDISQIQKQREEAEKAKKMSEMLLFQILPRDIVVRLNQGEVDISFVVPSSTVIFIDIVKFSDYAMTLSPAQIMENLSMVFAAFDKELAKHNLITKIKLIGDVYMAAAGLFNPDESPQTHAVQVVNFGLEVLQALEEVNTSLDSSLQVRIGVNTDGPLIAGVLGTDKPLFDIIGDPINVAARLQSTGIPGTVQISQATYELLAGMNFNIEARGEIMLKGKGKKMAYIVRPTESSSIYMHFRESQEFILTK